MPTGNSISLPTGVSGPSRALAFGQSLAASHGPFLGPFWGHPTSRALAFGQSFGGVAWAHSGPRSSTGTKGAGDNGRNGACSSTILGRSAVQWEKPAAKSGVSIEELERIR